MCDNIMICNWNGVHKISNWVIDVLKHYGIMLLNAYTLRDIENGAPRRKENTIPKLCR